MNPTADSDHHRIFSPLAPSRGRRSFADTWWGNAWVAALEGPTPVATGRLARGRTYARAGNVREITITPGRATAQVKGSMPTPYRTSMQIPQLSAPQWNALLDVVAAQAGHLAALLDRDMPTTLADDAAQAGVRLLPTRGELVPHCSCPDDGNPCKHAAALYYQVARLDQDPFVLLLLRGRGESELVAELHRRNAAQAAAAAPRGVAARQVFAAAQAGIPPLPAPPPALHQPGPVAQLTAAADPVPGVDAEALEFLAADAAARATQLLRQALLPQGDPIAPPELSVTDDAARLAAADPPPGNFQRLAWGTRRTPNGLARAAAAWHYGGAAALAILDEPQEGDPLYLRAVREEIKQNWDGERAPRLRTDGSSWLTVLGHDAQLRLGTDGRLWYPFRKKYSIWWPAGFPQRDATAVLSELLIPDSE